METELAFASDGTIYAHFDDQPPAGRRVFTGYALTAEERAKHGTHGLLRWSCLQLLALGSDGCVYIEEGVIEPEGRKAFRGYALTPQEAERVAEEVHRIAFNVTIAMRAK